VFRSLSLASVAARAEAIRLRHQAKRLAFKIVCGMTALLFLLAALFWLHVALWYWLRSRLNHEEAALMIGGGDLLLGAGQRLHPYTSSLVRELKKINYANRAACQECALRSRCTGNQFRSVSRLENEAVLDRMQARLAQRPGILDRRRETVEHPFGTIKQWMYQGAFLMRGLDRVRAEFSLTALAYNLRRVLNLVEFTELMAAVTPVQG
jgi:hypothetical protein